MTWPWTSRRVHNLAVQALERENASLIEQRDYWKCRAEQLIDAALARTGAIHQPTMEQRPRPVEASGLQLIAAAMAVTEIDSNPNRKAS